MGGTGRAGSRSLTSNLKPRSSNATTSSFTSALTLTNSPQPYMSSTLILVRVRPLDEAVQQVLEERLRLESVVELELKKVV